jgi:Flp pilus assembly protein TadG
MQRPSTNYDYRRQRRGALQAAQLLFVLPILLIVLFGIVQFGAYFMQQQKLQSAVNVAAQIASAEHDSDGQRISQAETAFYEALGEVAWRDDVQLEIDVARVAGEAVKVAVSVPTRAVLPDSLAWVGLGLGEQRMSAQAVMKRS